MLRTLPTLCVAWRVNLDIARRVIRRDARLAALGTLIGASRGYTDAEADEIRAAIRARVDGRRRRQVPA